MTTNGWSFGYWVSVIVQKALIGAHVDPEKEKNAKN